MMFPHLRGLAWLQRVCWPSVSSSGLAVRRRLFRSEGDRRVGPTTQNAKSIIHAYPSGQVAPRRTHRATPIGLPVVFVAVSLIVSPA
jgi:hypothetical protein